MFLVVLHLGGAIAITVIGCVWEDLYVFASKAECLLTSLRFHSGAG